MSDNDLYAAIAEASANVSSTAMKHLAAAMDLYVLEQGPLRLEREGNTWRFTVKNEVLSRLKSADELRAEGYAAGLDAAREAVERVSTLFEPLGPALAAIDALREEQAPPPLPPSVGVPSKPMWPLREEQK